MTGCTRKAWKFNLQSLYLGIEFRVSNYWNRGIQVKCGKYAKRKVNSLFLSLFFLFTVLLHSTVSMANTPPSISGTPDTRAFKQSEYSFVPQAQDVDGDSLRFSIINQPSWANFDSSTGRLWSDNVVYQAYAVRATDEIKFEGWLDSRSLQPASPVFDIENTNSYNHKTFAGIVDSLGQVHRLGVYFVKTAIADQWNVHVTINDIDLATVAGSSVASPAGVIGLSGCQNMVCGNGLIYITGGANGSGISSLLTNGGEFSAGISIDIRQLVSVARLSAVEMVSHTGVPASTDVSIAATDTLYSYGNLDSRLSVPTQPTFSPNDSNSFNAKRMHSIVDNQGYSHHLGIYFVRSPTINEWHIYLTINGVDVRAIAGSGVVGPVVGVFDANGQIIGDFPMLLIDGRALSSILTNGASFSDIRIFWRDAQNTLKYTSYASAFTHTFKVNGNTREVAYRADRINIEQAGQTTQELIKYAIIF